MKKHLIAAAVAAAVAVPAAAQVTIYGNIDTAYQDTERTFSDNQGGAGYTLAGNGIDEGTDAADTRGTLSSSRIGFKGSEDLGGGLKAGFTLEYEHNNGNGTTEVASMRTSIVGISGAFGTFEFGRQTTGIHGVLADNHAIGGSNGIGDAAYSPGDMADLSVNVNYRMHDYGAVIDADNDAVRFNNAVTYKSPTMNGFSFRADVSRDKSNEDSSAAASGTEVSANSLTVQYSIGKLNVSAGTARVSERDDGEATDDKGRTNAVSAKYDLGPVVLHGLWASKKIDNDGARFLTQDVMMAGLTIPMGAWSFRGQIGQGSVEGATDAEKIDTQAMQLAAIYSLSKRTSVYAMFGTDEAEQKQSANAALIGDKIEREQIAFGLRHQF